MSPCRAHAALHGFEVSATINVWETGVITFCAAAGAFLRELHDSLDEGGRPGPRPRWRAGADTSAEQIAPSPNLPRRRSKAKSTLVLEQAIIEIVDERSPVTVRGVCYALFTLGLIPDMSVNSTAKISQVMTDMREREDPRLD